MAGYLHLITQTREQLGKDKAQRRFLEVGEFVGEEVYFAFGRLRRLHGFDEAPHGAGRERGMLRSGVKETMRLMSAEDHFCVAKKL